MTLLEGVGYAVCGFGDIEEGGVGVELRSSISLRGSGGVVLEGAGDPLGGGLGGSIATDARFDGALQVVEAFLDGFSVGLDDAVVVADEGGDGNGFGGAEGSVPAGAMCGRLVGGDTVPHELLAGVRVLTFGEALEVFGGDGAGEAHLFAQLAVPLAGDVIVLSIVGLLFRIFVVGGVVVLNFLSVECFGNVDHVVDSVVQPRKTSSVMSGACCSSGSGALAVGDWVAIASAVKTSASSTACRMGLAVDEASAVRSEAVAGSW